MNRLLPFLLPFLLLAFCVACADQSGQQIQRSNRPNIIFILADDMGYGDPGSYNAQSRIPTPYIDSLARQGVLLTDAHAPGPWCVPSRYGLMTGQYPARIQLNWQERSLIEPQQLTLASMLQRNGYRTACVGKWHLGFDGVDWENVDGEKPLKGGPVERGFDYFFGMHASLDIPPYFFIENDRPVAAPSVPVEENQSPDATTPISGAFWRAGRMAPGFDHTAVLPAFTEKAVDFIREQQPAEQPFFLYLALTAPHTPWLPTPDFEGKSSVGEYGDFTMQVDQVVGDIMQALRQMHMEEETLLIFSSDNGPVWFAEDEEKYSHHAAGPLRGMKIDFWEGGHRIPFVARWPGRVPAGTVRDDLFCFTDMMATLAAVVGDTLQQGAGEDSYNMLPVLLNQPLKQPIRKELLIDSRVIRSGPWKYIQGSGMGGLQRTFGSDTTGQADTPGELYHLEQDLSESNNLYEQHPEQVRKMEAALQQYTRSREVSPLP